MTLDALANPRSAFSTEKQPCRRSRLRSTRHDFLIGAAAGMTLDALANRGQLFRPVKPRV
ncbi:MAG: hypothetical protein KKC76_16945 [Proteobacteria bacterium]|nr:hypothetical protein [Pseudomonadota bacterium]MCG2749830.1 hypothetical protein [Desulfobulbaceae bacterium]